jgi:drug/metabolite transporter (DMT)-like permease
MGKIASLLRRNRGMAIPARGPGPALLRVRLLTFTPLSRAYVFIAPAFAITPLAGAALFGEPISFRLVIDVGLIVCGLICVAG